MNFFKITRYPYEEPYHLHLEITVSNGRQRGALEVYVNSDALIEWADAFENFPISKEHKYLWEVGSERPEDRWAYYMRLRAFITDSLGHCAIHIRFNNNRDLPQKEIFEFCIPVEAAALNRFGSLLRKFSELQHEVMLWTPTDDALFVDRAEAEQGAAANP